MGGLDQLLTSEMDQEQWSAFRLAWIADYKQVLIDECGVGETTASVVAEVEFENYVGQEGYTARDERIAQLRSC